MLPHGRWQVRQGEEELAERKHCSRGRDLRTPPQGGAELPSPARKPWCCGSSARPAVHAWPSWDRNPASHEQRAQHGSPGQAPCRQPRGEPAAHAAPRNQCEASTQGGLVAHDVLTWWLNTDGERPGNQEQEEKASSQIKHREEFHGNIHPHPLPPPGTHLFLKARRRCPRVGKSLEDR